MLPSDILIVGGGAAGAVLASRLSEDASITVTLVEAGPDMKPGSEPADVASLFPLSTFNESYVWPGLKTHWRTAANSPAQPFQQGKGIGGSSIVMGMWALRGVPEDYDGWVAAGAAGWGWDDVLPYFRALETDCDFDGPCHGKTGPIPIRRQQEPDWSPLAKAVHQAVGAEGVPDIADMNADFRDGHCTLPISRYETRRAAAAICYLTPQVRQRPNLRILAETAVQHLETDGARVSGAQVRRADGSTVRLTARDTIVTAGALFTPALLIRSGIGPAAHLAEMGIPVRLDRAGVGKNLQNHPFLPSLAIIPGIKSAPDRPPADTYLRWSSGVPGCGPGDLGLYIRSYLVWHALGRRLAMLSPVLMKPHSTGTVRLAGANDLRVEFNFLDDVRDLQRIVSAFRRSAQLFATPPLQALCREPFVLRNAGKLGRYNRLSRRNAAFGKAGATAFDLSHGLGMRLLRRLAEVQPMQELAQDETALADYIQGNIIGTNHVCGTCRMGRADDPGAVVDSAGRVHGIGGLLVADASVMPSVPSGNTHLPTVMVAEKIAAGLRASYKLR